MTIDEQILAAKKRLAHALATSVGRHRGIIKRKFEQARTGRELDSLLVRITEANAHKEMW